MMIIADKNNSAQCIVSCFVLCKSKACYKAYSAVKSNEIYFNFSL